MDNGQKPNKAMQIILVLSLALNVAVIGAVAGLALSSQNQRSMPQRVSFEFGAIGRVLDRKDRRAIGDEIRKNGPRPMSRNAQSAQVGEIADALRATPFDPDLLTSLMAEMRDQSSRVQQNAQTAFVAHITAMSPEDRVELADRMDAKRR